MKISKAKKIAALLLILMIAQIFTACGGNEKPSVPDKPDVSVDADDAGSGEINEDIPEENTGKLGFSVSSQKENIPDSNFNGRDFVILVGDPNEQVWTYTNMVVEEQNGDTIDDAYYKRNRLVEDRLNILIKQITTPLGNDQARFKRAVDSGDNSFDIAMIRYGGAANLATSNYCVALNDVMYLDFDKPWWDKGSLRDLSISKRNYMMACDISIGDNDNTWLLYFDKQLIMDLGLELPYTLVENGQWTFDKLLSMMKAAEKDLNGDGRITVGDQFGLLTHGENYAGMWIAANQTLVAKDNDDMPYVAFNNETFINIWGKIIEIMNDTSCKANDIPFISSGLRDGQTLFGTEILKFVRDYRENEREFGILPIPKYNENQDSYHTYVAVSAPLLIIPKSNGDLDTTGIIVEAMAAEGHRTIMPAYYEVSIEGKFVRDVESIGMLDIAFATRKYDLGVVFNWGNMNGDLTNNLGPRKNADIASTVDRRSESYQVAIDKTFAAFEAD
ncbi:MAG: extracellular solute-binding protein [Oscillospiraceae bacterium]|nr:extracellular solute-binding protein [Oscillospiraceae bacterium]